MKERLGVFRHMNPSINPRVHCAIASYSVCADIPGFIRTEHISGHKASIFNWRRSLLSPPSAMCSTSQHLLALSSRRLGYRARSHHLEPPGFNPFASLALCPRGVQSLCQWGLSLFFSSHSPCIAFPHPTRAASASGFCAACVPSLTRFPLNMLVIDPHPTSAPHIIIEPIHYCHWAASVHF